MQRALAHDDGEPDARRAVRAVAPAAGRMCSPRQRDSTPRLAPRGLARLAWGGAPHLERDGGSHGWLGAALCTWKGSPPPEPEHTTQPPPKLRTPAAFATRANLTLTLEDEPESE